MLRLTDIFFSVLGILVLLPLFVPIMVLIRLESAGAAIFRQTRVGRGEAEFQLLKFRTMKQSAGQQNLLTIGKDSRITRIGYFLRKYKLDELPQLFNVLRGDMSLVGPRPEVQKYVELYTPEQRKVLQVRPGITDLASVRYANENEILAQVDEPEKYYIEVIMPHKIELNMQYIRNYNLKNYFRIIFLTIRKVFV